MFDLALQKLDILNSSFSLILTSESKHFIGHIEAIGLATGADAACR